MLIWFTNTNHQLTLCKRSMRIVHYFLPDDSYVLHNLDIGDNIPPSMENVCPKNITKYADKLQTSTIVRWLENDAWDNRDGSLR